MKQIFLLLIIYNYLYHNIRNKHFNAALLDLSKRAKNITSEYDENRSGKTVQEMKQLVLKLPYMLALKKQLSTCNHSVINFSFCENILKLNIYLFK